MSNLAKKKFILNNDAESKVLAFYRKPSAKELRKKELLMHICEAFKLSEEEVLKGIKET